MILQSFEFDLTPNDLPCEVEVHESGIIDVTIFLHASDLMAITNLEIDFEPELKELVDWSELTDDKRKEILEDIIHHRWKYKIRVFDFKHQ